MLGPFRKLLNSDASQSNTWHTGETLVRRPWVLPPFISIVGQDCCLPDCRLKEFCQGFGAVVPQSNC